MPDERNKDTWTAGYYYPDVQRKAIFALGEVARTPPTVGIFDEPTRCYRVNLEWASHIMGMVQLLADVVSWQDATDESYPAIQAVLLFLRGVECGGSMTFELRQSPDDNCILQQSLDGGTTWTDVFDFSLCPAINITTNPTSIQNNYYNELNNFQNNVYNNYVENYAGDITNIHPELGYGDADDSYRDDALCYALTQLVDAICNSALQTLAAADETAESLVTSLALVGAVLGILILAGTGVGLPEAAILAAGLAAGGIGVGAAVGSLIYSKLQEIAIESLTDAAAKEELVCCLLADMQGINANHQALVSAFAACQGLSDHATDISELGGIMVEEMLALYAAFAENLTIAYQSAKLNLLPECGCAEPFDPAISLSPCPLAGQACGTIDSQQGPTVWRISSTHRAEGNDEGVTLADSQGREFIITAMTLVSGTPILSFSRSDPDCNTTNSFGLGIGTGISNIAWFSTNGNIWTYDITVQLA